MALGLTSSKGSGRASNSCALQRRGAQKGRQHVQGGTAASDRQAALPAGPTEAALGKLRARDQLSPSAGALAASRRGLSVYFSRHPEPVQLRRWPQGPADGLKQNQNSGQLLGCVLGPRSGSSPSALRSGILSPHPRAPSGLCAPFQSSAGPTATRVHRDCPHGANTSPAFISLRLPHPSHLGPLISPTLQMGRLRPLSHSPKVTQAAGHRARSEPSSMLLAPTSRCSGRPEVCSARVTSF